MTPGAVIAIAAVSAFASVAPDFEKQQTRIEPKRYYATQAPEQAAACIARNAENQRAGAKSFVHPLYGMENLAVVMRDSPTGDTVATAFLEPASQGSHVKIITTSVGDNTDALAKELLAKC